MVRVHRSGAATLFYVCIFLGLLGSGSTGFGEDLRTWTDASGAFKKTAAFMHLDGSLVFLRLEDGSELKISMDKLSKADQDYVKAAVGRQHSGDPFEAVVTSGTHSRQKSASSIPLDDGNLRVVTVEGVGVDAASAKTDAYREAVRQVVGAYVDGTGMAANGQLIEDRVITLSSAFVEKSEPLKETQDGRLIRVLLRAHVRVNKLLDSLRENKISTTKVDSESLLGQAFTKADQAMGTAEVVKKALQGLHKKVLSATIEGKPEVQSASGEHSEVALWLRVQPNLDAYRSVADKLNAAWSAGERPTGEVNSPGNALSNGGDYRSHIQRWKLLNAKSDLVEFLASDADRRRMASTFDSNGNTSVLRYEPFYVIADAQASSRGGGSGLWKLQTGAWEDLTTARGDMVVLLLVNTDSSGARTRWKWFKLSADEAGSILVCLNETAKAVAVLKARDGSEITRESVLFANVGIKKLGRNAVAISPFFMSGDYLEHYSPALSVQRSVVLSREEVSAVSSIDAFME